MTTTKKIVTIIIQIVNLIVRKILVKITAIVAYVDSFNLALIGTYQILFEVNVDEAGQLILTLNGEDLEYTVVGRCALIKN